MKLRIRGNTLRLRLSRSELARLDETGHVEETIVFAPGARLRYALEAREGLDAPRADIDGHRLRVALPVDVARRWIATDDVGVQVVQPNGTAEGLAIVVEKDFACLHRDAEEPDAFPNPASPST
jgi:hypothetical protein